VQRPFQGRCFFVYRDYGLTKPNFCERFCCLSFFAQLLPNYFSKENSMSADNYYVMCEFPTREGGVEFRVASQTISQYYSGHGLVCFTAREERSWRKREYRKLRKHYGDNPVPERDRDEVRFGCRPLIPRTRDQRIVYMWMFWSGAKVFATRDEGVGAVHQMEHEWESEYGVMDSDECEFPIPTQEEAQQAAIRSGSFWVRAIEQELRVREMRVSA
jgi:hypothetical protein